MQSMEHSGVSDGRRRDGPSAASAALLHVAMSKAATLTATPCSLDEHVVATSKAAAGVKVARRSLEDHVATSKAAGFKVVERRSLEDNVAVVYFAREDHVGFQSSLTAEEKEALLPKVPLNDEGEQTSIGSILHEHGKCKPCLHFNRKDKGCNLGVYCGDCHLEHRDKTRLGLRQRLVMAKQLPAGPGEALSAEDQEALITKVPLNAEGEQTSIGSILHEFGTCNRCTHFKKDTGCYRGVYCGECHLEHNCKRKRRTREVFLRKEYAKRKMKRKAEAMIEGEEATSQDCEAPSGSDRDQVSKRVSLVCNRCGTTTAKCLGIEECVLCRRRK